MTFINLGILAHVDAGKTTMTEGMLYHSGTKAQMGNVDKGTTTTDSMELEQKRGMTIRASTVSFEYNDCKINLIDTPGHMDFIAEVERSLSVLDGVVLVISAKEGVQPQTRAIFHKLQELKIPAILFLNKLDRIGVDLEDVYRQIRLQLTDRYVRMQDVGGLDGEGPLRLFSHPSVPDYYQEQVILNSAELLENFADGIPITPEAYQKALRLQVQEGLVYPLCHGAALRGLGITELLDGITAWLDPASPSVSDDLSAYVYKVEWDARHHKKCYFRIYSGSMYNRQRTENVSAHKDLIIRNMFALQNGNCHPANSIACNDIGILYDIPELSCGDFIGFPSKLRSVRKVSEPLLHVGVRPDLTDPGTDRKKLLNALQELSEEDPFLSVELREGTDEILLKLFGSLQKEILLMILKDRYHLTVLFDEVQTILKEKPLGYAEAAIPIYEKENLLYAGICLSVEPLEPGSGFVYESKVSFGFIEKSFQNAVFEGIQNGLKTGLGHEVDDIKVTFLDAGYDSVMSTPSDYRRLAPAVIKKALEASGVILMEPILSYSLTAPCGCEKIVISRLLLLQATLEDISYTGTELCIRGTVPVRTGSSFAVELQTFTEGKGIFDTSFLEYRTFL